MKKLSFFLIALLLSLSLDYVANAQSFDPRGAGGLAVGAAIPIGNATAAAPTFVEGTPVSASFDLIGNMRVMLGSLIFGETSPCGTGDTIGCIVTSGAPVRGTVGNIASAVTTNTTSTAITIPIGPKSIYGSVTGTGAVTQTQKIYGGLTSGVTGTTGILLCTLTLSGTTTAVDACPVITANFLFYIMVSSGTTGTSAAGVTTVMY